MRVLALSSCAFLLAVAEPECLPAPAGDTPSKRSTNEQLEPEACLSACAGGRTLSKTDEETCRLVCERETDSPSRAKTLLARFEVCESRCQPQAKTDAATCALNCVEASLSTVNPTDDARKCLAPCLTTLHDEVAQCETKPKADAATCSLLSRQLAERCIDGCAD